MKILLKKLPEYDPPVLAVDLETTGLDPFTNKILSIALSDGEFVWIWLHTHEMSERLKELLKNPSIPKVIHNAVFDCGFLKMAGIEVNNVWDTLLIENVLNNGKEELNSLYDVAARRCGVLMDKSTRLEFVDHPGFDVAPVTSVQLTYMAEDVLHLPKIKAQQEKELSLDRLGRVAKLEMDLLPVTVNMHIDGLKLDAPLWELYEGQIDVKVQEIENTLVEVLGEDFVLSVPRTRKGEQVVQEIPSEEIKWNSPSQVKEIINLLLNEQRLIDEEMFHFLVLTRYAFTQEMCEYIDGIKRDVDWAPTDKEIVIDIAERFSLPYAVKSPLTLDMALHLTRHVEYGYNLVSPMKVHGTGVAVLQELLDKPIPDRAYQFIERLLEHRNWSKMRGWDYPKYIHPLTGKVHPEWRQMGAGTGRFSCSNPNLQNVPRPHENEPNLRLLWIPDSEDYRIIAADYSQQEPRILGQLCQDATLLEACNSEDVYLEFAKYLFGRVVEKKSEERYIAKQFVLATAYGAMPDKLHKTSGLPLERCEEIRKLIMSTFPGIRRWGQEQYTKLRSFGYTVTLTGRRRYFPHQHTRIYPVAVNSPVQGTAADMMKLTLVRINEYLRNSQFDARIWACVHDEVEVHVHKDQAEELQPIIFKLMEDAGHDLCPDVKHIAEGNILTRWDK